MGIVGERDVRPAAPLRQIAHQRPRRRDLAPERAQSIALAFEARRHGLIDLTVAEQQRGVLSSRLSRIVDLLTSHFEFDLSHARYRPRNSGRN